jgi:hypothetical protein
MPQRLVQDLRPGDRFVNEIERTALQVDSIKSLARGYYRLHCTVVWAYRFPAKIEGFTARTGDLQSLRLHGNGIVLLGERVKPDAPGLVPYVRRQVFEAEGMIARDHPKGGSLSLETPGVGPPGTFKTYRLFWKFVFWLGDARKAFLLNR